MHRHRDPGPWVYVTFWSLAVVSCLTLLATVLMVRWVFQARADTMVRTIALAVALVIVVPSLFAAIVAPVTLHTDTIPRTVACHGGL